MLITEISLAADLGRHFDALSVRWLVGGSVASSILGLPRATLDIDLVADLRGAHVTALYDALIGDFYVDRDTMRWAASTRRSFNAIHQASMIKVDVFCAGDDPLTVASSLHACSSISRLDGSRFVLRRTLSCKSSSGGANQAAPNGNGEMRLASCRSAVPPWIGLTSMRTLRPSGLPIS